MKDLDILRRRIERETGASIQVFAYPLPTDIRFTADDPELQITIARTCRRTKSQAERVLREIHEDIYRARAREKYRLQNGLCASCGRKLKGMGECDHILSRGAHGRDDRMENLQIVCPPFSGGCDFHQKKHGAGRRKAG